MCGITGFVEWRRDVRGDRQYLEKMTNKLDLRGPDDSAVWLEKHVGFGHKRLSIIDPQFGKQPMSKQWKGWNYTLVYNGELYNTNELRNVLTNKGYTFTTQSDTEVLLTAYIEWKEHCIQYVDGIFSFGVWDTEKNHLFMARDRLGVKPLFFHHSSDKFIFGSELKALLSHPSVKAEIDREGLAEIFGLGPSRTPGHGIFKACKELRAGHALLFSEAGLRVWRYWNVESKEHVDGAEDTAARVRELFVEAVERQLVSDVPLSTFLSGGLDSSAITAVASNYFKKHQRGPLSTFSIDYEGNANHFQKNKYQPSEDNYWIEKMVHHFSTEHHNEVIKGNELAEFLKEAVVLRDQPGMADIDSSLLWFCRRIKNHTTVSLSGECADEIFGGYPWFHDRNSLNEKGFPWIRGLDVRESLLNEKWRKKLDLESYVQQKYMDTVKETPLLDGESDMETKRRQLFYLNIHWFMAQLLDRKDRMSMGASLEVRVPYADHKLVEYVWNIPWEQKMHNGLEKGILRKALEGILPNEVLYRKKSPYPKTFQPEYTKAVVQWMDEILQDKKARLFEYMNKDKVNELVKGEGRNIKEPWYGQLMQGPQLIAHLCQIDYWLRTYDIQITE